MTSKIIDYLYAREFQHFCLILQKHYFGGCYDKRNINRFPEDSMFQLNEEEVGIMVSQNAILSKQHLGEYLPKAFTELGVAMLSSILKSERAIKVNIQIMWTFVKMKELALVNTEILNRLNRHDAKLLKHDKKFDQVFKTIQCLMDLPVTLKRKNKPIGFKKCSHV